MEDELLDIVDEKDNIVGQKWRSAYLREGLSEGQSVRVINILLFNSKGQLLVPKRSMNRRAFSGCYDFSCGEYVQAGEDYFTAAKRGIKEELGLVNVELEELGKLSKKEGVSSYMKVYRVMYGGEITNYDREGIDELNYLFPKEVERLYHQNPKKFKDDFAVVFNWFSKNFS